MDKLENENAALEDEKDPTNDGQDQIENQNIQHDSNDTNYNDCIRDQESQNVDKGNKIEEDIAQSDHQNRMVTVEDQIEIGKHENVMVIDEPRIEEAINEIDVDNLNPDESQDLYVSPIAR